jgi:hypothetical protein
MWKEAGTIHLIKRLQAWPRFNWKQILLGLLAYRSLCNPLRVRPLSTYIKNAHSTCPPNHRANASTTHYQINELNASQTRSDGDPWGLNPDLLVEMKDNSIGEESRHSRPDYNRLGRLCLTNWYTYSRGRCDLVEHDNPATRPPALQAIEELARTSRTSTELRDEYEVY